MLQITLDQSESLKLRIFRVPLLCYDHIDSTGGPPRLISYQVYDMRVIFRSSKSNDRAAGNVKVILFYLSGRYKKQLTG